MTSSYIYQNLSMGCRCHTHETDSIILTKYILFVPIFMSRSANLLSLFSVLNSLMIAIF
jgi:hypothetical protein